MTNNPLIEAGVILVCLLAVIAGGHYWQDEVEAKRKVVLVPIEVEQPKVIPKIDLSRFETAVKSTQ